MDQKILGLDLGTNSIGWALLEEENHQPCRLIALGSRVFQEAVEAKTRTPKNRARRDARQMRRQLARRRQRKDALLRGLRQAGLLPERPQETEALFHSSDPYALRKRGLDEPLGLHELGRAIFHLNQRRGFQSNRKAELGEASEEFREFLEKEDAEEIKTAKKKGKKANPGGDDKEGVVKAEVSALRQAMDDSKTRTLGEYLYTLPKKRNRYTSREMYREEFEALWEAQRKYHPEVLTEKLRVNLHNIIFHQRPLKVQKFLVGPCQFEPKKKRTMKGLLEAQRFRLLQDVNHLKVKDPVSRDNRDLSVAERLVLMELLASQATLTWNQARKKLGLHKGEKFNLEEGGTKDKGLLGNKTAASMRKALDGLWDEWPEEKRSGFVSDVLSFQNKGALLKRLAKDWGLTQKQAYAVATTELEPGYFHLSRKAMNKILPFLEQGRNYHDACQNAGYLRDDQKARGSLSRLDEPPQLRNPVVQKALYETRKVVNAIVQEHGRPDLIRVELVREMKLSKKRKEALDKQNRKNRAANERADEKIRAAGLDPNHDRRLKYRLWEECAECAYTGRSISMAMLFTPEVEIDHILPYSRSLDDSYMNKTLCLARENRDVKKNRSPYEAYSADTEKYEQILQRSSKLPWPKRRKFEQKEIKLDEFIERQMNDTRYISTEVRDYLKRLGADVQVVQGTSTAMLRHAWGLNHILAVDGSGEKNRADHRHHAIDAVVIALTSYRLFQSISRLSGEHRRTWANGVSIYRSLSKGFRDHMEKKVQSLIVSHAPSRKIAGALHEETAYGFGWHKEEKVYVRRVPLSSLKKAQIQKIRDGKIRQLVEARMAEYGDDAKKAFVDPLYLEHRKNSKKTPIHSVRVMERFSESSVHGIREDRERPYKFVKLGNNHHVEILENVRTGRRKGIFVSMLEAAHRARIQKIPLVQRDHGEDWKFVMSLMVNDMVEIEEGGERRYYRVQMLDGSNEKFTLRLHTAATLDDAEARLIKNLNTLRCRKVEIGPLGRILGKSND